MREPATSQVTRSHLEEIEIECPMESKDWALSQIPVEEGWRTLTIGPKRISLMEFDTSRLYLKAQRYLPNDFARQGPDDQQSLT